MTTVRTLPMLVLTAITSLPGTLISPASARASTARTAFVRVVRNGYCSIDDKISVRCNRLADRLHSMHVEKGRDITMAIDAASHEAVASTLASLRAKGYQDVFVFPPAMGGIPNTLVEHWVRFLVYGNINHPFPMVTVSTGPLPDGGAGEFQIVLPRARYDLVDYITKERMSRGDCVADARLIEGRVNRNEHMLEMIDRDGGIIRPCLLPSATESCDFLSRILGLSQVHWTKSNIEHMRSFAGEMDCHHRPSGPCPRAPRRDCH